MDSDSSESFQRQALPVPPLDKNFDPNKTPETGTQYLQYVLYERSKKCPDVVHVSIPPSMVNSSISKKIEKVFIKDIAIPMSQRQSTVEWQNIQINNFTILRDKINELRKQHKSQETSADITLPDIAAIDEWKQFCQNNQPLLRFVLSISLKNLEILLEYLLGWLQESEFKEQSSDSQPSVAWLTIWIYACLAYIFVPLDPNVYSVLREIARECRTLREKNIEPNQNLSFSLIICIISTYFRQLDLTDTFN